MKESKEGVSKKDLILKLTQNSARCLDVLEFSALNVGPKV